MTTNTLEHYAIKEKSKWSYPEKDAMLKDAKVMNILHNSLDNMMSNRIISCKPAKKICDALETQCQYAMAIKKNRRVVLVQEYEQFDAKDDESITDIYNRFLTLSNDISLILDTDEDSKIDMDDPQMVEMDVMLVKGFRRMRFAKPQRKGGFNRRFSSQGKDRFRKSDGQYNKERKFDKTKVTCYNCNERGHLANECPKIIGKTLVITNSNRDWMDSSETDNDDECYALIKLMERMPQELISLIADNKRLKERNDFLKPELVYMHENEKKECLGYNKFDDRNINKSINNTTPIKFVGTDKSGVESVYEFGSTSKNNAEEKDEPRVPTKRKEDPKMQEKKCKNIGLLSKRQLDKKICEVTSKAPKPRSKRGRNGKQGINKANNCKYIPNAPRKACFNCGNTNHVAIDCRKPQNKVSKIPDFDISGRSENKKNVLVLDSGCSTHMTGTKSLFPEYEEKYGPIVSYEDGNVGKILGYGNIIIGNVIMSNVALVDGLKHNLLSISQITDRGFMSCSMIRTVK
ncbi:uncharacterized protein LOC141719260 [Apium graveolens]|uniref:uncharacterized protein LOC141719260 n=1 Tax=Apium graveolens TaxID=4045 RepID=UPI003D79455C